MKSSTLNTATDSDNQERLLSRLRAPAADFSTKDGTFNDDDANRNKVNAGGGRTGNSGQAELVEQDMNGNIAAAVATIGYAVSVTGCGSDPITEGAAVLKHSIHLSSIHGNRGGKYNYQMYAIYHPSAKSCALHLKELGYELLERETFVNVQDIEGEFLRTKIEQNGCCGEKELIKLEAYTLIQHPVIVHLDLDVLILKPLDSLYDVMLNDLQSHEVDLDVMWPELPLPEKVNAFFTRDYNMVSPGKNHKPAQGGFLVLRPDLKVYTEFKAIVKKGDFQQHKGWGGIGGVFYGSMTFQGLIPYYYDVLHPQQAIELNRCVYNQMCDNPRDKKTVNDVVHGNCRTGRDECEDCRSRPIQDVVTAHFTLCQKPWLCLSHDQDMIQHRLCRKLHHEWFSVRSQMEQMWGRSGYGTNEWAKEQFFGYCRDRGKYERIAQPYPLNASSLPSSSIAFSTQ